MSSARVQEVKKLLAGSGFIVYRALDDHVQLAERVRENLIMEANVSVVTDPSLRVRFIARAQRSDFPSSHETPAAMFERARRVGSLALSEGFREQGTEVVPQLDPVDSDRVLDVWYQVVFDREVGSLEELPRVVTYALGVEKVAPA